MNNAKREKARGAWREWNLQNNRKYANTTKEIWVSDVMQGRKVPTRSKAAPTSTETCRVRRDQTGRGHSNTDKSQSSRSRLSDLTVRMSGHSCQTRAEGPAAETKGVLFFELPARELREIEGAPKTKTRVRLNDRD